MRVQDIKPGTVLISNSQWGPTYVQTAELVASEFGDSLTCRVLYSGHAERDAFVSVPGVQPEDMKGIGWKIPTAAELDRLSSYVDA